MAATPTSPRTTPLSQLRTLAGPLIVSPVILAALIPFVVSEPDTVPAWAVAAGPALAVVGFLLAQMVGYPRRVRLTDDLGNVSTTTRPEQIGANSLAVFRTSMFLRLALVEGPLMLAFVLAVVVRSPMPYFSAVGLGVLAVAWHVWPSERLIDRCVTQWEQDGHPCYLRAALAGR